MFENVRTELGFAVLGISFVCAVTSANCGDSARQEVEYELSCEEVRCPNADETSTFETGDSQSFTCTWNCACYEGTCGRYVSLDFWVGGPYGNCWTLETEYTDSGICN